VALNINPQLLIPGFSIKLNLPPSVRIRGLFLNMERCADWRLHGFPNALDIQAEGWLLVVCFNSIMLGDGLLFLITLPRSVLYELYRYRSGPAAPRLRKCNCQHWRISKMPLKVLIMKRQVPFLKELVYFPWFTIALEPNPHFTASRSSTHFAKGK
jgi:hypothetical protein